LEIKVEKNSALTLIQVQGIFPLLDAVVSLQEETGYIKQFYGD
jgi:hypothetical protein